MHINEISGEVVDSAVKVHKVLGPGLLESAYKTCLTYELRKRGLRVRTEVAVPVIYDGLVIDAGYRIDLLVEEMVIVECKAKRTFHSVDMAQALSHLRLSGHKLALLINFHVKYLKHGIIRVVNNL